MLELKILDFWKSILCLLLNSFLEFALKRKTDLYGNYVSSKPLIILLRCPLVSTLDPLWFQWAVFLCLKERMSTDISVWRAKIVPASSAASKTAEQGRGGKAEYTYELPKLTPIREYFFQQLSPCSIWFIGLVIFTYEFHLIGKIISLNKICYNL